MIDLATLKAHLRVTHNAEDSLIQTYLDAATELVETYLRDGLPSENPAPVDSAILLLAADLYLNRESQGRDPFHQNQTYQLLLAPYRDLEVQ